jgi:hypothetical protein
MCLSCRGIRYDDAAALIPVVDLSVDRLTPLVFIDRTGQIVLSTPYHSGGFFSEGLAPVSDNGGCGYIDSRGRKLFWTTGAPARCDDFSEGLAVVQTSDSKFRYIDKNGKWAIPQTFKLNQERMPDRHRFRDGRAAVLLDQGWGFIDRTGTLVGRFDEVRWFHEGLAAVEVAGKWGFVDTSCTTRIAPRFDAVSHWIGGQPLAASFSGGLAAVRLGKTWGYIDKTGAFAIPPRFDDASDFHEGLAAVKLGGAWKYIDDSGRVLFDAGNAVIAGDFWEGLATVHFVECNIDGGILRSAYIDRTGRRVLPVQYSSASRFRNGLACVTMDDGIQRYIDRTGKQIFTVAKAFNPADVMAQIRNSTDPSWLKRVVADLNLAASLAQQPLARGGVIGIRASAYCRLGELATEESLSAVREIERRAALMPPAPPKAWYGFSPAPPFHFGSEEIKAVATTVARDRITYALVEGGELGDLDAFITSSPTPDNKASWTRQALIPNRLFMSIRDPRLIVDSPGLLEFSFIQMNPGNRNLMEGTDAPWPSAPRLGPQRWRLSIPEITKDSDGDGWTDFEETRLGLNPHNPDSDGDGIPDGSDVCPNYAPTAADARDEQVAILQRAFFTAFGFSGSRHLLLAEPNEPDPRRQRPLRKIQLWGYGGPVLYGQTREGWASRHQYGAFFVSWGTPCIRGNRARVEIRDYQGPLASGYQYVVLRKIGNEWFAVQWIEGSSS